ncbi:MAG: hypothetical protein DBX55_08055 [Verrucomicrobia bacterium]|nr:MAG: hypothetical protein DBX55_08055 [Verrucomicrobiota bacterium]
MRLISKRELNAASKRRLILQRRACPANAHAPHVPQAKIAAKFSAIHGGVARYECAAQITVFVNEIFFRSPSAGQACNGIENQFRTKGKYFA